MSFDAQTCRELSGRFGAQLGLASRGDRFTVTNVMGLDPRSGKLPPDPEAQFRHAFENVRGLAATGLFPLEEVGRLTVFTPQRGFRPLINDPWRALFPQIEARPARKTTHVPLSEGQIVALTVEGVHGGQAVAIEIDGVSHKDPLPMGCRIGRYAFSSVIPPDGPTLTGDSRLDAITNVYRNLAAFVQAAGADPDEVANVWVYLGMWDLHPEMVDAWMEAFPDGASRPSRKTFYYPDTTIQLQCDIVTGGGRDNLEISGIGHHDPIPMGAVTGGVVTSSGVDGRDPSTGAPPRGVAAQSAQVVDNARSLLASAGFALDNLWHVTGLVGHRHYIPEFVAAWDDACAGLPSPPALEVLELGLPARDILVQAIVRGVGQ